MKPCRLQQIFEQQKLLMEKYHHIEVSTGYCQDSQVPVTIDSMGGQARLKDLAWRVTEELVEAQEVLEINPQSMEEYREELVDALHFYVELLIVSGIDYEFIYKMFDELHEENLRHDDFFQSLLWDSCIDYSLQETFHPINVVHDSTIQSRKIIQEMGLAMHELKNKLWKKTTKYTNVPVYRALLVKGFLSLLQLMLLASMSAEDIYKGYVKKRIVNEKRQKENY